MSGIQMPGAVPGLTGMIISGGGSSSIPVTAFWSHPFFLASFFVP